MGTGNPPFQVTKEQDPNAAPGKRMEMNYFSITNMPSYQNKSFEELRFEDYSKGNKGSMAPVASAFGAPAAPATGFGGFGQPATALGATQFGAAPAPAPAAFGGFGAPAAPAAAPAPGGFGAFGAPAATPAPAPAFGGFGGFGATQPAASTPFGAAPAPSLFSASAAKPPSTGFGAPAATSLTFGAAPAPSPFGATPATPAAASAFGGFGAAPAASPFGATPGAAFGAPAPAPAASGLFGGFGGGFAAAPATSAPSAFSFGGATTTSAPSLLGGSTFTATPAPAPATTSFGGFGLAAPAPAPALGATSTFGGSFGAFGKPAAAPAAFGLSAPAPLAPSTGLFGASTFGAPAGSTGLGLGALGGASAAPALVASHNQNAFGALGSQVGLGAVASSVLSLEQKGMEIRLDGESTSASTAKGLSEADAAAAAASDVSGAGFGITALQSYRHTPRTAARIRPRGYVRPASMSSDQQLSSSLMGGDASHDAQILSPESYLSASHRRLVIDPNPRSRHSVHSATTASSDLREKRTPASHDGKRTPAKQLFDDGGDGHSLAHAMAAAGHNGATDASPRTPASVNTARAQMHTPSPQVVTAPANSSGMVKPKPVKMPGQHTPAFERTADGTWGDTYKDDGANGSGDAGSEGPEDADGNRVNGARRYDNYHDFHRDQLALDGAEDGMASYNGMLNPNAPILRKVSCSCARPPPASPRARVFRLCVTLVQTLISFFSLCLFLPNLEGSVFQRTTHRTAATHGRSAARGSRELYCLANRLRQGTERLSWLLCRAFFLLLFFVHLLSRVCRFARRSNGMVLLTCEGSTLTRTCSSVKTRVASLRLLSTTSMQRLMRAARW